jgi:autophagy-related protein 9
MEPRGGSRLVLPKDLQIPPKRWLQSDPVERVSGISSNYFTCCLHNICSPLCELSSFIQVNFLYSTSKTFLTTILKCLFEIRDDVKKNITKVTINDVLYSSSQCHDRFNIWTYSLILIASIFWVFRAITIFFHIMHNKDIKSFFNVALKIDDCELENYTWHEVQRRIRQAQNEMQLCIHKENLTELDIYHRILR